MIGTMIADIAYLTALICNLGAFLLVVEWLMHLIPGAALNPVRRLLFQVSFPLLKFSNIFFPVKWGNFNSRGLLLALFLMGISLYGVPWLVFLSYSLRG